MSESLSLDTVLPPIILSDFCFIHNKGLFLVWSDSIPGPIYGLVSNLSEKVKSVTQGAPEYTYAILEEKYDRIVFGYKNLVGKGQTERVFYKKTLKYKWASISNKNSLIAVYQCQKMN